jgi:hypothetical protein
MIDIGTIRGLHQHGHELHAYCLECNRWVELDLQNLITRGWGDKRVPFRLRCLRCRGGRQAQVRPVMPRHNTANGWVMPATR